MSVLLLVLTVSLFVYCSAGTHPMAHAGEGFNLSRIRTDAFAYAESLRAPEDGYGAYREPRQREPNMYASCDVAVMRTIMGEDFSKTLTEVQRQEWITHINSYAQPDGTYQRYLHHSFEHANGMAIGALGPLGGRQMCPVRLYDAFDHLEKIAPWLERLNWRAQWSGSHLFWGGVHCYSKSARCTSAWRERVFDWLDTELDPKSGWWRKGMSHPNLFEPLGGAAHIWPIYQHHKRRFLYPERVIDSILAMQKPGGNWLDYGNYMELDALYGLVYMSSLAQDYRRTDIPRAARKHGQGLVKQWPVFLARKPPLHTALGAVGAFGLLNQLLPDDYRDTVKWTDIFSDARLYQTDAVEVLEKM